MESSERTKSDDYVIEEKESRDNVWLKNTTFDLREEEEESKSKAWAVGWFATPNPAR